MILFSPTYLTYIIIFASENLTWQEPNYPQIEIRYSASLRFVEKAQAWSKDAAPDFRSICCCLTMWLGWEENENDKFLRKK